MIRLITTQIVGKMYLKLTKHKNIAVKCFIVSIGLAFNINSNQIFVIVVIYYYVSTKRRNLRITYMLHHISWDAFIMLTNNSKETCIIWKYQWNVFCKLL